MFLSLHFTLFSPESLGFLISQRPGNPLKSTDKASLSETADWSETGRLPEGLASDLGSSSWSPRRPRLCPYSPSPPRKQATDARDVSEITQEHRCAAVSSFRQRNKSCEDDVFAPVCDGPALTGGCQHKQKYLTEPRRKGGVSRKRCLAGRNLRSAPS